MSRQGTQVTLTIPEGAPPGTLLSVPVRGGAEQIKVRVPDGMGAGSTLVLTQAEGSDEWSMQAKSVVPVQAEEPPQTAPEASASSYVPALGEPSEQQGQLTPYQPEPQPALEGNVAYTVRLDTTVGIIDIIVRPDWAPHGTRRFLELAAAGDLSELAFYRAIKGCIVQFGLPAKRLWPPIPDDPPTGVPFLLGAVSFAAIGENTRRSTLFICIGDMSHMLGQKSWETPIGAVAESSLDVLESIDTTYGDIAEFGGSGPDTNRINSEGNGYLRANFPCLSYIRSAWPLDWQPEEGSPTGGAALQTPNSVPMSAPGGMPGAAALGLDGEPDQAAMAAQAAREAQLQAQNASEAAARAAVAQEVVEAAQAAQAAQQAAKAAMAAAEAAKAAQAAQMAQAAKVAQALQAASEGLSASKAPGRQPMQPAESAPIVRSAPPMYPGSTDLAAPLVGGTHTGIIPWTQPDHGEPVDVPVEVRSRPRPHVGASPTSALQPLSPVARSSSFARINHGPPHHSLPVASSLGNSLAMSQGGVPLQSSVAMQPVQLPMAQALAKPALVPQHAPAVLQPGFSQGFNQMASPMQVAMNRQLPLR